MKEILGKLKEIFEKINFRQRKYTFPAVLYFTLLIASYPIINLFVPKKAEPVDQTLEATEFLNPNIPEATIRGGDGIGSKYENMEKSWGRIADHTAVDIIERDNPDDDKEIYESQYSSDEVALMDMLEQQKTVTDEDTAAGSREVEALRELEKALAEARLRGQAQAAPAPVDTPDLQPEIRTVTVETVNEDGPKEKASVETPDPTEMIRKVRLPSDYFHTISQNQQDTGLIKAIIDEDIKAVDGSRVRLRLLDDVEINGISVCVGTYLYATMSGFSSQRVKGTISSVLVNDEIVKVNLSIYDTDGMEGLYVPSSAFRETAKDVASGAASSNMSFNSGTYANSLTQWGMQTIQNAYQKAGNAVSKAIRKNRAKLKYGTFVYLVNEKDTGNVK